MSATAFSGTAPPPAVGTGRFSSVARSRRGSRCRLTRIGICRSDRENLALFCVQVAQGRDADGLADALHRHAELRREVQARLDQDLRARQVAVDARIAQLGQLLHLVDHLAGGVVDEHRIVAGQVEGDVAAAVAAVRWKCSCASGICLQLLA